MSKELIRNNWIEISLSKGLAFEYSTSTYIDNRHMIYIALGFIKIFLHLPIYSKREPQCEYPRYGFYFFERQFWLCLGMKLKAISLPWAYTWIRRSYLMKNGSWETERKGNRIDSLSEEFKEKRWSETYDYTYKLRNGTIQEVKATITVDILEWRMIFLKWTSLFAKVRKGIWANFSDEVGEGTGSWKGGCVGCGYDLLPNETPLECLRRMEKERSFNR